jgi:DNA-binding Lrp family transcriptional regulator
MGVTLDRIDNAILRELTLVNCRTSYRALAKKTGVSPNTAKNRVRKLVEDGIIIRFVISMSHETAGTDQIFGFVFTSGTENSEEFVSQLGKNPMISSVSTSVRPEGGAYLIFGRCMGAQELAEIGATLRRFDEVQNVELHLNVHRLRGAKTDFSRSQLKVIGCLIQNARMKIEEIAKRTGMASKTVRRLLRELKQSEGLFFSCLLDLSAGGLVNAFLRIEWDDKKTSAADVVQFLQGECADNLWWTWISASEPVMFADLCFENILDLEHISRRVRAAPFVKSTASLVISADATFELVGESKLRELLDEVDP